MANIIFDFDGTIADSFDYVLDFLCREAGKPADYAKTEAETYRRLSMKDIALQLGIPYWRLPYIYFKGRRIMRQHVLHIRPFKGVPELIKELAAAENQLSIISANSTKNVRAFLREYDLNEDFDVVRGGAGIFGKILPIRRLKRRFTTGICCYIGDEVSDMVSAKAAGVVTIGVTWGFASHEELERCNPDAIVDKPAQVKAAIDKLALKSV